MVDGVRKYPGCSQSINGLIMRCVYLTDLLEKHHERSLIFDLFAVIVMYR